MITYNVTVDSHGDTCWFLNGELHREDDKPAIEYANGSKVWYKNGELHREDDKPAIEYADGDKEWFINGELHREDGAAVEYSNGDKKWFLNGVNLTEEEFNARNEITLSIDEIASKFGIDPESLKIKK